MAIRIKTSKSANFDRNLDSNACMKSIKNNTFRANSLLKNTMDSKYIPVKTGKLKQNTTTSERVGKTNIEITTSWNQDYAGIRYNSNKTNPSKTKWVQQAYRDKKTQIKKIMSENVVK
ncbi:MAG: hypothetical protein EHM25_02530 [Nitrosopumilales archaeon]|nr:MAG: hypothetical protein EHM25_12575 [Nitrosopumilales archaeon]RPJ31529.1 MAG: hypothetical protein EHM25_02530 [Nitrosopumilales archaeon]